MATKASQGVYSIEVDPYQLKNLLGLLRALPTEVQQEVRDLAQPMSKRLAGQLTMFGMAAPAPQTKLVLQSITTPRDRLIRVDIGGTKKVGRPYGGETSKSGKSKVRMTKAPAGALLWGSEYGSHAGEDSIGRRYTNRFKTPYKKSGYWIAPAVEHYVPVVAREYEEMIVGIAKRVGLD